jgi:hypothetical protein
MGGVVTGKELFEARATLGMLWGLGKPLGPNELARALRLTKNGASNILAMERGAKPVSGPIAVCIETWLATGYRPPHTADPTQDPIKQQNGEEK